MTNISSEIENQVVINKAVGEVRFEDIGEFIIANVDSWKGKSVIWDLTEMDFHDISSDEIRLFMSKMAPFSSKRTKEKTAIIAPQDVQYGMMRVFESYAEYESVQVYLRICRSMDEGKNWLLS